MTPESEGPPARDTGRGFAAPSRAIDTADVLAAVANHHQSQAIDGLVSQLAAAAKSGPANGDGSDTNLEARCRLLEAAVEDLLRRVEVLERGHRSRRKEPGR